MSGQEEIAVDLVGDDADNVDGGSSGEASTRAALVGVAIILLFLVALAYGIGQLAPDDLPVKNDPGFIDNIFNNVVVVAAARLLLLAGAGVLLATGVYIVISMGVRMGRGEWLRRAGPFEADLLHQAERLGEAEDFFDDWMRTLDENSDLEERLEQRDEAIQELLEDREKLLEDRVALVAEVNRLQGGTP